MLFVRLGYVSPPHVSRPRSFSEFRCKHERTRTPASCKNILTDQVNYKYHSQMSSEDSSNQQWKVQNVSSYKEIIRQTVAECLTLSDKTKKEVLHWFSTNCDGSRRGSSSSTGSPIAGRKSGVRSEKTSELNSEIPKKRRKLSEPDEALSDKENDHLIDARHVQTGKAKKSPRYANSFIDDDESTVHLVKNKEKDEQKKLQQLCDSDSDDANSNQRKPSFGPEHKVTSKNTEVEKPANFSSVEQIIPLYTEEQYGKKSFFASLSKDVPLENADPKAVSYRVEYRSKKEELCKVLYKEFNEKVFDNKLPKDMPIEWSDKLQTAAGKYKYYQPSSKSSGKMGPSSRIVLARKILDSPDKLRSTLIHEMCHAAARLINNVCDGHGSIWKSWATKAVEAFPELITISRCHDYEIETKYTYRCTCCGYGYGRQVTSLNLNKHRCRYCRGPFELLINTITDAGLEQKKIAASTDEPSEFALYVKEKYHVLKQSQTSMEHAEIIQILKQQFSAIKATPK